MNRLERATPPIAALAVAVVAVSTSAILVRWSEAPSHVVALYRVLFTTLLLAPVVLSRHRTSFERISARDLLLATVAGVALAVPFTAWFESLDWTSVAASTTLVQSQVLFVALGATLVLNERPTRRMTAGMVVALAGIAVMSAGDALVGGTVTDAIAGPAPLYGNVLAVLGAVCAAGYVLTGRALRQRISLLPYVTVVYVACVATLLVLALAEGTPLLGYPRTEWLLFVGMAIGPGILGHTVLNWALEHVESSVVSVSLLGEPVGSTLLAVLLLAEFPSTITVLGGVVVLVGLFVTTRARPANNISS